MTDIVMLLPLGVIGLVRWLSWLVRRIPAVLYQSFESDYEVPMSLVTPVYQEDPELFRQAIESWLANDLAEIICVIDHTDVRSIEVARQYPVQVIITDVPGKRDALRKGWEAASSPIVALVDSDTLWARDAREQILKPFADPDIGGVGTRQNVYNPENVWQNINDMYLDYRYFDEIASQTRVGKAVSCLSGRTAAYRRDLLLEISHDFMTEKFLGVPCNSGEDKRLTSLILERGHRTYMQRNARVWSTFPPDPGTFFKQRLRWSRNTWRSDLRALKRRWIFRHKFLAFTTIDKAVASFTLMIAPAYMIWALITTTWSLVGALIVWWIVSRAAKHLPHLHRKPVHFFIIPIFVLISFAVALVKIYALLTVRKQRWLTRQVEVIDGQIVRTNTDPDDKADSDDAVPGAAPAATDVPDVAAPAGAGAAPGRELVTVGGVPANHHHDEPVDQAVAGPVAADSMVVGTINPSPVGRPVPSAGTADPTPLDESASPSSHDDRPAPPPPTPGHVSPPEGDAYSSNTPPEAFPDPATTQAVPFPAPPQPGPLHSGQSDPSPPQPGPLQPGPSDPAPHQPAPLPAPPPHGMPAGNAPPPPPGYGFFPLADNRPPDGPLPANGSSTVANGSPSPNGSSDNSRPTSRGDVDALLAELAGLPLPKSSRDDQDHGGAR